jgi:acetyl/propionyl-CoA carboxylase alpha subunit
MTFDIEINGRARAVSVERAVDGRYRVIVDGHAHVVDAARIGSFGLSLLLDGAGGASREVQVSPGGAPGEMLVRLDGMSVTALVDGRRTGRASADGAAHTRGEQSVVAPMPGRVVRLLVDRGDEVTARQGVVVVEAMKMENELRSPKDGRVKEVAVTPGASVEAGRVLVVIE